MFSPRLLSISVQSIVLLNLEADNAGYDYFVFGASPV
jgi:hypothetical protein